MSFDIQENVTLKGTMTFVVNSAEKKNYAATFKQAANAAEGSGLVELAKEFSSVAKKLSGRGRPRGSATKKSTGGEKSITIKTTDEKTAEEVVEQKKPLTIKAVKAEEVVEEIADDEYAEYEEFDGSQYS
jgi:hypothetical protein